MTVLRVTDRATGTVLGETDTADRAGKRNPLGQVTPLGPGRIEVVVDGWRFDLIVEDAARADLRSRATRVRDARGHHGPTEVRAIIPGRVASVGVAVGDAVTAGMRLLAVEAMKMENDVRSPRDGTVERVTVAPGQTVELGDVLVVIA